MLSLRDSKAVSLIRMSDGERAGKFLQVGLYFYSKIKTDLKKLFHRDTTFLSIFDFSDF